MKTEPQLAYHKDIDRDTLISKITRLHRESFPKSESEITESEGETTTGKTTEFAKTTVKKSASSSVPVSVLYNVAMMLRRELEDGEKHEISWPPLSEDFDLSASENIVPIPIYNMIDGKGKSRPLDILLRTNGHLEAMRRLVNFDISEELFAGTEQYVCAIYGLPKEKNINEV